MAITWSSSAVQRAGLSEADLLVLSGERLSYDPAVVSEWKDANLRPTRPASPPPRILFTAEHIRKYAAMHDELFGTTKRPR